MTLRLASTSALRATADKSLAQGRGRLRSSTFALPPSRSALRRTSRAPADRGWIRIAVMTAVAVLIGGGSSVFACPVCFAAEETSMINGTRIGILVLLAVTLVVQGAFVGFFLYLRKRAKQIADMELDTEWSELQRATR
jgi:hypothetical protein